MEDQEKEKLVKDLSDEVHKGIDKVSAEQTIKNNFVEFEFKDKAYKVRKPTFAERQSLFKERIKFYTKLLNDKDYPLESELRDLYKKRGIDIDEMDVKLKELEKARYDKLLALGKALKENASDTDTQLLKKEVEQLASEQTDLTIKKTDLTHYSLETQVNMHIYLYLASVISEVKEGDSYVRLFKTFEDLENCPDEELVNKLVMYASLLVRHELEL